MEPPAYKVYQPKIKQNFIAYPICKNENLFLSNNIKQSVVAN